MPKQSPKQIVDSFWRAFASRKLSEAFEQHMTADCEFVMPGVPPMKGELQIRAMFEAYLSAFPDFFAETTHAMEAGDSYAAETRFAGTHRAALVSPQGSIPATGRRISWHSADIIRIRDQKIASWHVYHDTAAIFAQLAGTGAGAAAEPR